MIDLISHNTFFRGFIQPRFELVDYYSDLGLDIYLMCVLVLLYVRRAEKKVYSVSNFRLPVCIDKRGWVEGGSSFLLWDFKFSFLLLVLADSFYLLL